MDAEMLKNRTKKFGLEAIKIVERLPNTKTADVIGKQLLRSATSVGANYRSACRGRSKKEFIAKAGIAIEEADESMYWMEMLIEAGLVPETHLSSLHREGNELVAILTASVKTASKNLREK